MTAVETAGRTGGWVARVLRRRHRGGSGEDTSGTAPARRAPAARRSEPIQVALRTFVAK